MYKVQNWYLVLVVGEGTGARVTIGGGSSGGVTKVADRAVGAAGSCRIVLARL